MIFSLKGHTYNGAKDQAPWEKRIFLWFPKKDNRYSPSFQPVVREIKVLIPQYHQQAALPQAEPHPGSYFHHKISTPGQLDQYGHGAERGFRVKENVVQVFSFSCFCFCFCLTFYC